MSPARQAREKAGLGLEETARSARICVAYLRRVERSGGCSYPLALRLARLYRCSASVFLLKGGGLPERSKREPAGTKNHA
jgi:hypothetical protein